MKKTQLLHSMTLAAALFAATAALPVSASESATLAIKGSTEAAADTTTESDTETTSAAPETSPESETASDDTAFIDDLESSYSGDGVISLDGYDCTFSDRDLDASYDEKTASVIAFSDSSVQTTGDGVSADGTTVTITAEGTYVISGSCQDGQILVNAPENAKVQLVFDGLELQSSSACPLLIQEADKVFLTLADGSKNTLADSETSASTLKEKTVDAAIYSAADLTINGSGSLDVTGNLSHGILSKDDLCITGGTISVTSVKTAVEGKDALKLGDCTITVNAGSDGLRSTNETDEGRGFVWIHGSTLDITAGNDGIQAYSLLYVEDGTISITTGGGSANAPAHSGDMNDMRGRNGDFGGKFDKWNTQKSAEDQTASESQAIPESQTMPESQETTESEDTASEGGKGLKSDCDIVIADGTFTIDTYDDAIHCNDCIELNGGSFTISSGDDGIHADSSLTINNGSISILTSYEGIEGSVITVNDGTIDVVSSDDGFNAAGGNDGSSFGTFASMNPFDSDTSKSLTINGGTIYVSAQGDGLDSNGGLYINGGIVLVDGPDNSGNGALDYGNEAVITGGYVVASGASGMSVSFTSGTQCFASVNVTSSTDESIVLCDEDGNILVSFTPTKSFGNVVVSTPELVSGESYSVYLGSAPENAGDHGFATEGTYEGGTAAATLTATTEGSSGGFGGKGGMGGGRDRMNGEVPEGMEWPSGETPEGMERPSGEAPEGMEPPSGEAPEGMEPPSGEAPNSPELPSGEVSE